MPLIGNYSHNVDAKGRVFIPAKYRSILGDKIYMLCGIGGCVRVYNEEEFNKLMVKANELKAKNGTLRRKIIAQACEVDVDSQGRALIPEYLRSKAAITDKTIVNGMTEFVELWNPVRFDVAIGKREKEEGFVDEFSDEEIEVLESIGIS